MALWCLAGAGWVLCSEQGCSWSAPVTQHSLLSFPLHVLCASGESREGQSWLTLWPCEPGGAFSLHGADGWDRRCCFSPALAPLSASGTGWVWLCWTSLSSLPAQAEAQCLALWLSAVMATVLLVLWPLQGGWAVLWWGCAHLTHSLEAQWGTALVASMLGLDVTFGWCCQATRTAELFLCSLFSWGTNCIS